MPKRTAVVTIIRRALPPPSYRRGTPERRARAGIGVGALAKSRGPFNASAKATPRPIAAVTTIGTDFA